LLGDAFSGKIDKTASCWNWTGSRTSNGYGMVSMSRDLAHRIAYRISKGPIPLGKMVMHSCDNRLCVNPDHLRLGTAAENTRDMMSKGRNRFGRLPPHRASRSGLTWKDIAWLRKGTYPRGELKAVAERYGLTPEGLSKIADLRLGNRIGASFPFGR
jgi:hypothetical protein